MDSGFSDSLPPPRSSENSILNFQMISITA